jgi:hypothetical protein
VNFSGFFKYLDRKIEGEGQVGVADDFFGAKIFSQLSILPTPTLHV